MKCVSHRFSPGKNRCRRSFFLDLTDLLDLLVVDGGAETVFGVSSNTYWTTRPFDGSTRRLGFDLPEFADAVLSQRLVVAEPDCR